MDCDSLSLNVRGASVSNSSLPAVSRTSKNRFYHSLCSFVRLSKRIKILGQRFSGTVVFSYSTGSAVSLKVRSEDPDGKVLFAPWKEASRSENAVRGNNNYEKKKIPIRWPAFSFV